MEADYIYELMDAHLRGRTTREEADRLDTLLKDDPGLQEEFRLRKLEHEAMDLLMEDDLRTQMKSWEKEVKGDQIVPLNTWRSTWRIIGMAASIVLIIGLWVLAPWKTEESTLQQMAMEEYQPNFSAARSDASTGEDPFDVIRQVLREKNTSEFPRAMAALDKLTSSEEFAGAARYYLGHLAWAGKEYQKAADHFKQVPDGSPYKGEALIDQALALMVVGQEKEARSILENLSGSDRPEGAQARRILSRI